MSYCELHCSSAFSFLRSSSFPEQLAEVAAKLEMPAMALLDDFFTHSGIANVRRNIFILQDRRTDCRPKSAQRGA